MGVYRSFMDDELIQTISIQFISENDNEYRFRINTSDSEFLTISKKCFPKHEWMSGTDGKLKRNSTIEMY